MAKMVTGNKSVMCWWNIPRTEQKSATQEREGKLEKEEIIEIVAQIGRTEAKKSAEWQEKALKRTILV